MHEYTFLIAMLNETCFLCFVKTEKFQKCSAVELKSIIIIIYIP